MASNDSLQRSVLPIPDRKPVGLTVDTSEASFEDLAEQHEVRARIAMATQ